LIGDVSPHPCLSRLTNSLYILGGKAILIQLKRNERSQEIDKARFWRRTHPITVCSGPDEHNGGICVPRFHRKMQGCVPCIWGSHVSGESADRGALTDAISGI
jgi:hypothetical protein